MSGRTQALARAGISRLNASGPERLPAIDGVRGLAIMMMAVGNFIYDIRWIPDGLRHAPDIGYTIADLVAPIFIVSIGFTVRPSMLRRRKHHGTRAALIHMVKRATGLIGVGAVLSVGQSVLLPEPGINQNWGVLQAIGAATLLLLPFVYLEWWARLVAAVLMMSGYQLLLDRFWLQDVLHASHNGIWGSLSWASMLLLSTVIADGFYAIRRIHWQLALLFASSAVVVSSALLASPLAPISKNRASASYMLLSLGLSLLLLACFAFWLHHRADRVLWLQYVGRNPLALYLANLLLMGIFTLPNIDVWHAGAPVWLTLLQVTVVVWMNLSLSNFLQRRGLVLRF